MSDTAKYTITNLIATGTHALILALLNRCVSIHICAMDCLKVEPEVECINYCILEELEDNDILYHYSSDMKHMPYVQGIVYSELQPVHGWQFSKVRSYDQTLALGY